jgi:glycosyltransferase involved in cell wall biosynthesis
MPPITFFTVATKNHLARVRVLMDSIARWHPECRGVLFLADQPDGCFDPSGESFEVVPAESLGLPTFFDMALRYDAMEFTTAFKPFGFQWLFAQGAEAVIYLDSDIEVHSRLDQAVASLRQGDSVVLTPHANLSLVDDFIPDDHQFLKAGVFNLGFMAARNCPDARRFIEWWGRRLQTQCISDQADNLFVDQRWCDLAPALVERLAVLKAPGYNLAYWNLPHRHVSRDAEGRYRVEGEALVFFHFSGLVDMEPEILSRFQTRYRLADLPVVAELVTEYRARLDAAGQRDICGWPYSHAVMGGIAVDAETRNTYRAIYRRPQFLSKRRAAELLDRLINAPEKIARIDRTTGRMYRWLGYLEDKLLYYIWRLLPGFLQRVTDRWWNSMHDMTLLQPELGRKQAVEQPAYKLLNMFAGPAPIRQLLPDVQVSKLMHMVWSANPDLRAEYDLDNEKGSRAFVDWYRRHADVDYAILPDIRPRSDTSHLDDEAVCRSRITGLPGVNLVGYARGELGIGEQLRLAAAAFDVGSVPFSIVDFNTRLQHRQGARHPLARLGRSSPGRVNLFNLSADQMVPAYAHLGDEVFAGKYNIGYWPWELSVVPDAWLPMLAMVDEIWAISDFVRDAFLGCTDLPVIHMPQCIALPEFEPRTRAYFGLPENAFVLLYVFDFKSFVKRKNPFDVVRAFRLAFPASEREPVCLVLKTMNGDDRDPLWRQLMSLVDADPRIVILNQTMARHDVLALMSVADSFVSLHRAEGFGLGIAEAMALGKPVIVTNYSGNTDFTKADNACLVDYELVPVKQDDYHFYQPGQAWAQPDVEQAASYMRRLKQDVSYGSEIGAAAAAYIGQYHSPAAIGQRYAERLACLGLLDNDLSLVQRGVSAGEAVRQAESQA